MSGAVSFLRMTYARGHNKEGRVGFLCSTRHFVWKHNFFLKQKIKTIWFLWKLQVLTISKWNKELITMKNLSKYVLKFVYKILHNLTTKNHFRLRTKNTTQIRIKINTDVSVIHKVYGYSVAQVNIIDILINQFELTLFKW